MLGLCQKNGVSRHPMSLSMEVSWMLINRSGKSCLYIVFKLSLAAIIYWLWKERNSLVFQGKKSDAADLFGRIDDIRAYLCGGILRSRIRIGYWLGAGICYSLYSVLHFCFSLWGF